LAKIEKLHKSIIHHFRPKLGQP